MGSTVAVNFWNFFADINYHNFGINHVLTSNKKHVVYFSKTFNFKLCVKKCLREIKAKIRNGITK